MTRLHIYVIGRVQGVLYRKHAQAKAKELGITGWAKNLLDGTVEIVAEGEKEKLQEFTAWCKQGPAFAKVEKLDIQKEDHQEEFKDFAIHHFGF
jgi:acylphosphatase